MPRGWIRGKNQPLWHLKVYDMWSKMWNRCRNPEHKEYEYYCSCIIYEDFRYLSNYLNWIQSQPRFEEFCSTCHEVSWTVDKDIKDPNNRHYLPQYMTLCTKSENTIEVNNRCKSSFGLIRVPVIGIGSNILLFKSINEGKAKGFSHIHHCLRGDYSQHKGYKWYKINYKHNLRLRKK